MLTFPSETGRARRAVERVVRWCPAAGAVRAARLRLVLGEAVANAVRHGNRSDSARRVRIAAEAGRRGIRVAVEDEGDGFDPAAVPDPTRPGRRGRPGGRGLFLQRRLADEVRHEAAGRRVVLLLRAGR